jgi:hypothetical protein
MPRKKKKPHRTADQIYRSLPKLKPVDRRYTGHHNALCSGKMSLEAIDLEMDPIDKDYMDKVKLFVDETAILQGRYSGKKLSKLRKKNIKTRCERVMEYAEMKLIYDRQVQIAVLLDKL